MVVENIIKTYSKKEDITKIIEKLKNIKFDELAKTDYYFKKSLLKSYEERLY